MSLNKIIGSGLLITGGRTNKIIKDGAVYIEDNLIKDFGKTNVIRNKYNNYEYINANGRIIMPGLICTHHHLYSTFACGLGFPQSKNFTEILNNLWWKLDKALTREDIYYSSVIPLIKGIKSGTTTIIDHHASPNTITGSLNSIAKTTKELNVRAVLCYEVSDRDGEAKVEEGINENIEFLKRYGDYKDDMLGALFGLHASFTLSDKTLKKVVDNASSFNAGFHIHVAEDMADVKDSLKKYNKRVAERLYDAGIFNEKSIAVHCIHISENEMELLQNSGASVVNNPSSNMNNAVGTSNILEMIKKGILVGLGSDGMTSNMFNEVNIAYLIQRHNLKKPDVAFVEAVDMLLKNNAKIASKYFKNKVGVIEKDAFADIIIIDYYPYTSMNEDNFYGHFMFGMANSSVDTTIINGKIVMQDRKLTDINEKEIYSEALKYSKKVWDRF